MEDVHWALTCDGLVSTFDDPSLLRRRRIEKRLEEYRTSNTSRIAKILHTQHYYFGGVFGVDSCSSRQRETVLFNAMPRNRRRQASYRLKLNPSKVSRSGLDQIAGFLADLDLDLAEFLSEGKVADCHVALDRYGLSADDVIPRSARARKHQINSGAGGRIESIYCGSRTSRRYIDVYTKVFRGAEPGRESALRFEARLRPRCLGRELPSMPNPFSRLGLVRTSALFPVITESRPLHAVDSLRVRGRKALDVFSDEQKKAILRVLDDPEQSILPDVERAWRQWPVVLSDLGLSEYLVGSGSHPPFLSIAAE